MQFETMSFCLLQATYYNINAICKLFSYTPKPIHTLLASKRCLIGLQKTPFKTLTNALLKSNQAPFLILLYN